MLKSKIIPVILGLLLSFVTMAADNSIINDGAKVNLTGGTYTAKIIAPKATVYSDENMLSPLGYISNGKTIIVGNPRRMNRDLVPTVVYGRLAFIEIKDIRYEDAADEEYNTKRGAPREHNVDATIQPPEEKLSVNNSAYFTLHTYDAGDDVKHAFASIDSAEQSSFTGFNLHFIHRKEMSRLFYGAGFDYSSISSASMKFNFWLLSSMFGYTPLRNKLFLIDVYATLDLGINGILDISTNFVNEPTPWVWGPTANARIVFFPDLKYHVLGGVGIKKYNVIGVDLLRDANDVSYPGIKGLTSVSFSIGLGMEFN
ncbi:MAG: hypothetical protein H7336_12460 [Bacteriovorax sp.]|nr:hypothetical protein [Bacteriovorax sp.]